MLWDVHLYSAKSLRVLHLQTLLLFRHFRCPSCPTAYSFNNVDLWTKLCYMALERFRLELNRLADVDKRIVPLTVKEIQFVDAIGRKSFRQKFPIRTRIPCRRKYGVQHNISCCPVVRVIQIGRIFRFFLRVRREYLLRWVMCKNDAWSVLTNQPDNSLPCCLAIRQMPIGKTQELYRLNS